MEKVSNIVQMNDWLQSKARRHEKLKQYREAARCWNILLGRLISRRTPNVSQLAAIHYRLGLAHRALNDDIKSIYHLKYSVRLDSSEPRYYDAFGRAFLSGGHWRVAKAQFDRALELDPENPIFLRRYAWVLLMMGKPQAAIRFANRALKVRPKSRETRLLLARSYLELRRFFDALRVLQPISKDSRVRAVLAQCKSDFLTSFEGAVLDILRKGMVFDGEPFDLRDFQISRDLWFRVSRSLNHKKFSSHLPSVWAAALAWMALYMRGASDRTNLDEIAVRFGSSTSEIWPCVLRLQRNERNYSKASRRPLFKD